MIRNKWIPNHFVISIKYIKNYQKLLLAASLSTTSVSTTSGESKLRWGVVMFPAIEKWRSFLPLDAWITRIRRARRAKSGILQSVEVQNFRGFSTISHTHTYHFTSYKRRYKQLATILTKKVNVLFFISKWLTPSQEFLKCTLSTIFPSLYYALLDLFMLNIIQI